jgi:hypothetical protein
MLQVKKWAALQNWLLMDEVKETEKEEGELLYLTPAGKGQSIYFKGGYFDSMGDFDLK